MNGMDGSDAVRVTEQRVVLAAEALQDLRDRLARTRRGADLGPGWERGVPDRWLAELLEDWQRFDPAELQVRLDRLHHLRAEVGGRGVHAVYAEGSGPDPLPLLLTHGWPGSFLEYVKLIPLLSDPGRHGADPADAFTVLVPSLPGYGFSDPPPPQGLTRRHTAGLWHALMADGLGHGHYVAHGSDLGVGVTAWLARDHPEAVAGIHLATPSVVVPPGPRTAREGAFLAEAEAWTAEEGGYLHEHATKPGTLGAALSDSPAGLAAWIAEKVVSWSSTWSEGAPAFDRDLLLATLTLYWATGTITSSLLPYWTHSHSPNSTIPVDDPSPVPTAITIFGGERVPFPKPPRELAERYYNVTSWGEHAVGGHFPAVAEPELLARILRDSFRSMRR